MKRILCFMLGLCLLLTVFAGCGNDGDSYTPTGNGLSGENDLLAPEPPSDPKVQELSLIYYAEKSMNPYLCTDYTNRALFGLLYQSLFIVDREYNVEPMLCKQFSVSADMRSYTFYMENATFSDGSAQIFARRLYSYMFHFIVYAFVADPFVCVFRGIRCLYHDHITFFSLH